MVKTLKPDTSEGQRPDMSVLNKSIAYSLRRAQLSTYGDFLQHLEPLEVRPSQYTTLVLIASNPGLTQTAISTAIGIQKANFVALLDRLEQRGLTERRKVGGDRRSSALYLTSAGKTFVTSMQAAHSEMEARLLERLGGRRSQQLLELLQEFTASSEESVVPGMSASDDGTSAKPARRMRPASKVKVSPDKASTKKQSARPKPLSRARAEPRD